MEALISGGGEVTLEEMTDQEKKGGLNLPLSVERKSVYGVDHRVQCTKRGQKKRRQLNDSVRMLGKK